MMESTSCRCSSCFLRSKSSQCALYSSMVMGGTAWTGGWVFSLAAVVSVSSVSDRGFLDCQILMRSRGMYWNRSR